MSRDVRRIFGGFHPLNPQSHTAYLKVFFKAIRLQKVGELESTDIATACSYFTLKIDNEAADVFQTMAATQQLEPLSFPVKTQLQGLTGQTAVELMGLKDQGRID
jgi:hypothetical protein